MSTGYQRIAGTNIRIKRYAVQEQVINLLPISRASALESNCANYLAIVTGATSHIAKAVEFYNFDRVRPRLGSEA
jgi:hypothetical protein